MPTSENKLVRYINARHAPSYHGTCRHMPAHLKIITLHAAVVVNIFMFATMIYFDFHTYLGMKQVAICL